MTTTYDVDPNTNTIAAAWASSELGEPDDDCRGFAAADEIEPVDDETPTTKWALLAAALAVGIIGGAGLGMVLDYDDQSGTTVIPGSDVPAHAVVISPSVPASKPAADAAPVAQPTVQSAPEPVVSAQPPAPIPGPQAAPAPGPQQNPPPGPQQDPGNAGVAGPPVVIDVPVPNNPPADPPDQQDPQPPELPDPQPPTPADADDPTFTMPKPENPQLEEKPTLVTGRFTSPINDGNPGSSKKRGTGSDQEPGRRNSLNP